MQISKTYNRNYLESVLLEAGCKMKFEGFAKFYKILNCHVAIEFLGFRDLHTYLHLYTQ